MAVNSVGLPGGGVSAPSPARLFDLAKSAPSAPPSLSAMLNSAPTAVLLPKASAATSDLGARVTGPIALPMGSVTMQGQSSYLGA